MDDLDGLKREAAAQQLGFNLEEIMAAAEAQESGQENTPAEGQETSSGETAEEQTAEEEQQSEELEQVNSLAESMSDADAVAYALEKHPDLKGCFGTNDDSTQLAVEALSQAERIDSVTVMGFDAGSAQLSSLESGDVDGLIVQNPFGMGYAAVIAGARTVLEIGNEAEVDTGYIWVDQENMEDESIQAFLYE